MKSRKTMTYAVAAGVAATVLLTGCNGGDEDPTSTPTPSGSSTGSPTPSGSTSSTGSVTGSPTPSVSVSLPSAARANTNAGAQAFANFFYDEMTRGYTTLESTSLRQFFSSECDDCLAVADDIDTQAKAGIRHASPASKIRDSLYTGIEGKRTVDLYVTNVSVKRVNKQGTTVGQTPAGTDSYRVRVSWTGAGWSVDEIGKI